MKCVLPLNYFIFNIQSIPKHNQQQVNITFKHVTCKLINLDNIRSKLLKGKCEKHVIL